MSFDMAFCICFFVIVAPKFNLGSRWIPANLTRFLGVYFSKQHAPHTQAWDDGLTLEVVA